PHPHHQELDTSLPNKNLSSQDGLDTIHHRLFGMHPRALLAHGWDFGSRVSVSQCSCRGDFRAGGSHDHRVLGLGHNPAAQVEKRRIRHHGPGPDQRVQEGWRSRLEPVGPALREWPCASIARWLPSPIALVDTLAWTASIAVCSASSDARTSSVQFRVSTSTVTAVSAIQPSSWAPRSSLTTFPWRNLRASSCVGE